MRSSQRATQRAKILEILLNANGNWIGLPQIAACAAQYNARIFELRRLGFRILNRTKEVDGVRHSWFKLETGPPPKLIAPVSTVPPGPQTETPSLFEERRISA